MTDAATGNAAAHLGTQNAELVIFSTLSAKEALLEIVPRFEQETRIKVNMTYGGGSVLSKQLLHGSDGDLFIGPQEFTQQLIEKGVLSKEGSTDFARSFMGMAIPAQAPVPDIGSTDKVLRVLLSASSVSYSAGASGIHFVKLLERFEIVEQIAPKMVLPKPGELVGSVVARGEAEVGVQQISELLPVAGIQILELPEEFRQTILYGATPFSQASQQGAAATFVSYLRSEAAGSILRSKGLQPVDP